MNIVIFRPNKVRPISITLSEWKLKVAATSLGIFVLVGLVGNLFWLQSVRTGATIATPLASGGNDAIQAELIEQRSLVDSLRDQADSESRAVGRRLARLQAQFMRLEALGQRLTEVAGLVDGEFSFGQPAALGGPGAEMIESDPAATFDFVEQLEALSTRLESRETELRVLDGLLVNQNLEEQRSPRDRPVTWGWLSSSYGKRVDPITGNPGWHRGVDFAGEAGSAVVAVAGGVVTHSGEHYGYGKLVEINHGDGYVTRYGHHQSLLVKVGDVVKKGEQIGFMGSTGRSTGPHVHFEVIRNGKTEDPQIFLGLGSS